MNPYDEDDGVLLGLYFILVVIALVLLPLIGWWVTS